MKNENQKNLKVGFFISTQWSVIKTSLLSFSVVKIKNFLNEDKK